MELAVLHITKQHYALQSDAMGIKMYRYWGKKNEQNKMQNEKKSACKSVNKIFYSQTGVIFRFAFPLRTDAYNSNNNDDDQLNINSHCIQGTYSIEMDHTPVAIRFFNEIIGRWRRRHVFHSRNNKQTSKYFRDVGDQFCVPSFYIMKDRNVIGVWIGCSESLLRGWCWCAIQNQI